MCIFLCMYKERTQMYFMISQVKISNFTSITRQKFGHITRSEPWQGAKDLALAVFGRSYLATHLQDKNLAGKEKEAKPTLNAIKIADIIGN